MYRQGIPTLDLWVERGTENVPDDGKFHVRHNGKVVASHSRESDAVAVYARLKKEWNAEQPGREEQADKADLLRRERVHFEAQAVLAESGRRRGAHGRRKGGKGR